MASPLTCDSLLEGRRDEEEIMSLTTALFAQDKLFLHEQFSGEEKVKSIALIGGRVSSDIEFLEVETVLSIEFGRDKQLTSFF